MNRSPRFRFGADLQFFCLIGATSASLLAACGGGTPVDTTPSEPGAVEAVLALRWDTLTAAFGSLAAGSVQEVRTLTTEMQGEDDRTRREIRTYNDGRLLGAVTLDSSGTFDSGWADRLVADPPAVSVPLDHWTGADPPYESPRRRDDFRFVAAADTTVDSIRAHVYRVTPRHADEELESVAFVVAAESNQVIAIEERRRERAPFFRQETRLAVRLARDDNRWRAGSVLLDVTIDPPGQRPRRYQVDRVFYSPPG